MTLSVIRFAALRFAPRRFAVFRFAAVALAISAMLAAEVSTSAATVSGRHGQVVNIGPASFQIATQRNNNNARNLANNNLANGANLFAGLPNQLGGGAMNPRGAGIPLRGSLRTFSVGPNTVFTSTHAHGIPMSAAMLRPGQYVSVTAQDDLALRVRIISGGPSVMRLPRTRFAQSRPRHTSMPVAQRSNGVNPAAVGSNATTVRNAARAAHRTALADPSAQAMQAARARHAAQEMAANMKPRHAHQPRLPSQHHAPHMSKVGTHGHS